MNISSANSRAEVVYAIFIPGYPRTFLKETVYVNDCKRQSGRYDTSESLCLVNICVLGVCRIIAHPEMTDSYFLYISRSRRIVTISVWDVCPIIAHSQNGVFVTFYISGSRCIVNIKVWRLALLSPTHKMADS